jgi:gliding motility-associated-like protein
MSFKSVFLLALFIIFSKFSYSQLVYANQGGTAQALVSSMIGPGLTVTNPTISCPNVAYGTFTGGSSTNIGINSGIVLSTGNISTLNGAGSAFWSVDNPGTNCNDPQLNSIEPLATRDCCILEFDVVPSCSTLLIRFVFGSEEYPEFVSSGYNDAFGFFVTGPNPTGGTYTNTNIATLPDNSTIVSIDNVNAGTNSTYYVNNSTGASTSIKLDAFTTVLTREIVVEPCQTYHFKLGIADAGDGIYDSGVFIDFLDCSTSLGASFTTTPVSCLGNDGSATATAINGFPPYTYSWNTTPAQTTQTISGLAAGTYQVTVDDAGSCTPPVVQTVVVPTDVNVPSITITGETCVDSVSTLTATPTIPGGTFSWTTGDTTAVINVIPDSVATYTCTYSVDGCITTASITVTKKVITTFNPISALCQGTTPLALPASSSNIPTITGTWNTPIIATNTPGITNYIFTPDSSFCATNDTLVITINTTPIISLSPNQTICQGQQATIYSTIGDTDSGGTYDWQPVDSTTANLTYFPDSTMIFSLVYTLNGCPSLPVYSTVTVNPNIPVYAGLDSAVCVGDSVLLDAYGTPQISWSNNVVDSSFVAPLQTTTYIVTGTSSNGCVTQDAVTIVINPLPVINPGTPPTVCIGTPITLAASGAGQGGVYFWNNSVMDGQSFVANSTQTYTVTGVDTNGCINQATIVVTVLPLPNANLTVDPTWGYVPFVANFTNTSINSNSYYWDFGNGLDTATLNLGQVHTTYINAPQDYIVTLVASNGYCDDTATIVVKAVLFPEVFVPNVFTPNADGSNETFMVDTKNMASIELIILNRWGNVVAEINSLIGGWDGKTQSGAEATAGVYFYKYVAKGMNGEEFEGQGFLTLIR